MTMCTVICSERAGLGYESVKPSLLSIGLHRQDWLASTRLARIDKSFPARHHVIPSLSSASTATLPENERKVSKNATKNLAPPPPSPHPPPARVDNSQDPQHLPQTFSTAYRHSLFSFLSALSGHGPSFIHNLRQVKLHELGAAAIPVQPRRTIRSFFRSVTSPFPASPHTDVQ